MSQMDGNGRRSIPYSKWTYEPGKRITIAPLNLHDIQRQLLDSDESEDEEEEIRHTLTQINTRSIPEEEGRPERGLKPEREAILEKDDILNIQSRIIVPYSEVNELKNIHCGSRNGVENSTNHCDKPSHEREFNFSESLMEEPEEDVVLLLTRPAYTKVGATLCENNKENIPPKPTNLKIDDSFDWNFSSLMHSRPTNRFSNSNSGCTHARVPSPQPGCSVNMPYGTLSVAPGCKNPIIYKGSAGFDRIMVNGLEYIMYNLLGRGGSSEVYHGFNPGRNLHVAIKLATLTGKDTAGGCINEVKLLESLQDCDRIVKMYDYEIKADKLIVVMEKGGEDFNTILKQLAAKKTRLPTYMVLFYWMEMLHSVKQIHARGIIHSDLKPSNFLRNEKGLKLIDFGIASKVQDDMTFAYKLHQEGTTNYISPEALMAEDNIDTKISKPMFEIHFKSDVWSLGCILYQFVYSITPFQNIQPVFKKFAEICNPNHQIDYPEAKWAPRTIVETIKKCLQFDIKARPSVDELIQEYEELLMNL